MRTTQRAQRRKSREAKQQFKWNAVTHLSFSRW